MTFPPILDSSILSVAKSCRHKFWLEFVQHYKPAADSVHLHAGASFAAGLEAARRAFYIEGLPEGEAVARGAGALLTHYGAFDCPEDSPKSATRMAGALEFYFSQYPLGGDGADPITLPGGARGIEFSFAEPLPIKHPETEEPILYCGRMDMVANFADGVFVEDDKTASSLGASWSRQWDLRSQFSGYCWGLSKAANIHAQGVLVRGVSILKTKYETLQAITYRPEWMVDEWFSMTCDLVEDLIRDWKRNVWRKTLDHACTDYSGCAYRQPCNAKDPDPWLAQYFVRREWNPLTREERLL